MGTISTAKQDREREQLASRVAGRINRIGPGQIDAMGRDLHDYLQIFAMRAWISEQKRKGPAYVFTSVRNQLKMVYRELSHRPEMARLDLEPEPCLGFDLEGQTLRRDLITKLSDRLPQEDLHLLVDYVDHGCNAGQLWKTYGKSGSKSWLREKVRRATQLAREILQELENPPSFYRRSAL